MLKFFENEKIVIDDMHAVYPYTYEVIDSIKKDYDDELYLVIGSDNLENLYLWKNIDKILKNKVIVLKRGNDDIDKLLEKYPKNKFIVCNDFEYLNVSSINIRNGIYENIDERVLEYIETNKLYI